MSADATRQETVAARLARQGLSALRRALMERSYRGTLSFRLTRPRNLFQASNLTALNRYPDVFNFVQSECGTDGEKHLLSFGCATGEEVFTLRHYFPDAFIAGIDINRGNIATCIAKLEATGDNRMKFKVACNTAREPDAHFDAIFCMAVLRHGDLARPGVQRCDHLVHFKNFDEAISGFVRCLKPGGLLAVYHSNFRVCDASAAVDLVPVFQCPEMSAALSPVFGPDNCLMENSPYLDVVFRKARGGRNATQPNETAVPTAAEKGNS
jgi:SAM-dependent methyltransferase